MLSAVSNWWCWEEERGRVRKGVGGKRVWVRVSRLIVEENVIVLPQMLDIDYDVAMAKVKVHSFRWRIGVSLLLP